MNEIIEFFTDPLRLTLLVAAIVVVLGILIFGRRSNRPETRLYHRTSHRDFKFNNPPPDMLVDEEVIVLPPRRKAGASSATASESAEQASVADSGFKTFESTMETPAEPVRRTHQMGDQDEEISMSAFEYPQVDDVVVPASQNETVQERAETPAAELGEELAESVEPGADVQHDAANEPALEKFIMFHIVPANSETFSGKDIHQVASSLGLGYGKHDVYHFPADNARAGNSQFCLVNMTPEGNFDRELMPALETRGVSLILRLSEETKDGLALFSNLVAITQGISRRLGGSILDQSRAPLTPDRITMIRSDIAKFHTMLNKRSAVTEVE